MPRLVIDQELEQFKAEIWEYYWANKREFPWRDTTDPYRIMVSEIMLQQTQTGRVIEKYRTFLEAFPTAADLAKAPVAQVLTLWQGLGYNRRALNLQRAAQKITQDHNGVMPEELSRLEDLPGIGRYTAGAIAAFAFNRPVAFIETNIRRIYIHHFFEDEEGVTDKELMPLIEQTVDQENPREWYYALMDYGAALPKTVANPNRRSKHYTKQSAFEGSNRQVRGRILAFLVKNGTGTAASLTKDLKLEYSRITACLTQLRDEGFIAEDQDTYSLTT